MIIGLCGLAGSGKDTAADFLVDDGFIKVALADPLKRIARDVFAFTEEQLWGPSENRNAPDLRYPREHAYVEGISTCLCCGLLQGNEAVCYLTPRYALQLLGTEYGRHCFNDIWVNYGLRVADSLLHKSGILRSLFYSYDRKLGLQTSNTPSPSGFRPKGVVFSDIRFLNEVQAIREAGGYVYQLTRGQGLRGGAGQHKSETEMKSIPKELFAGIINNKNWSLGQLQIHMSGIQQDILKGK